MRPAIFILVAAIALAAPFRQALAEREFSGIEKEIIKDLVSHPIGRQEGLIQVAAFIDDHYIGPKWGLSLFIQVPERKVFVSLPEKDKAKLQKKLILTLTIFNLIHDLQQEGQLALVGDSQRESVQLGTQFKEGQTVEVPEPIVGFITDSITKYVLVSEDLKQLVANDFKTPESLRHQQTMIVSIIAIIVAILLGLWGVWRDLRPKNQHNNANAADAKIRAAD